MLPSASLGVGKHGDYRFGLYEPSGGSAPDIAGKAVANPIAQILSMALMLRYSFGRDQAAARVEEAVRNAIKEGFRTRDICAEGTRLVSTKEMGDAIRGNL
jgi:3-isopropylmalate dehydrogenase